MLVDEIKGKLDIVSLAKSEGLELTKQSGRILKAKCCFHNEKTASLTFYPETNSFHCYGCGETGDPINFYAKRHNLSLKGAITELAQKLGVGVSFKGLKRAERDDLIALGAKKGLTSLAGHLKGKEKRLKVKQTTADTLYRELQDFCNGVDDESRTYLTSDSRGLTDETIKKFGLFSIRDYKKAKEFLLGRFSLEELRGLALINQRQNRFLFTKHKIIIPVVEDGQITALRGRYFNNGFSDPAIFKNTFSYGKYQSTAGVGERLFNGDILKTLKPGERVYLCEGEFDTMILDQHGHNAVGLLGVSNYSDDTIKRLNPFDLVIAFDSDERGRAEALKISNLFFKQTGREVIREKLPDGVKDITELFIYKKKHNEKL